MFKHSCVNCGHTKFQLIESDNLEIPPIAICSHCHEEFKVIIKDKEGLFLIPIDKKEGENK